MTTLDASDGCPRTDPGTETSAGGAGTLESPTIGLDLPFAVTTFNDFAASSKDEQVCTLRGLAARVQEQTAPTKKALPWLKLARFGNEKTPLVSRGDGSGRMTGGSLRHDANVLEITGIEADYDGEQVDVADAVERLEKAGILAMVYTSPSHTADTPRWRVICPTSAPLAPDRRSAMMGRLNGLFRGIFSAESWTLSQGYYYGSVNQNPSHEIHLIDGSPIDVHDDLDESWQGKPATAARFGAVDGRLSGRIDEDALLADIIGGASYHESTVRLLGRWARCGVRYMEARQRLLGAFDSVFPLDRDERWNARRADVDRCLEGIYCKEARQKDLGLRAPEPTPHPGDCSPGWDRELEGCSGAEVDLPPGHDEFASGPADVSTALCSLLSIESWASMDIPPPDRLLGDLLTTTTRAFLVGRTGLGKTLFGLAIGAAVASGRGFLGWSSSRPARVLYLDGEMPAELIKPRAVDAMRRVGGRIPAGNLLIFGRDIDTEARRVHPTLPPFAPLNTDNGRLFLFGLLAAVGGVDLIIFDNVMSLIEGDQKDEVPWSNALGLVSSLTDRRIGQLWLDHTGHNGDRQYGSSTKAWRFDLVGIMTPLADDQHDPHSTGFTLSFDHPGKARRRTPDNWREFETRTIQMRDDEWVAEPHEKTAGQRADGVRPAARSQYKALLDALVISTMPGRTTRNAWYAECVRLGLADKVPPEAGFRERDDAMKTFRTHLSSLKVAGWIGVDGDTVTALRRTA